MWRRPFQGRLIFPCLKKGNIDAQNYRGISFADAISKLFGLLLKRLENWCAKNDTLSEYQAGFRKFYSTNDNIFILFNIIKKIFAC